MGASSFARAGGRLSAKSAPAFLGSTEDCTPSSPEQGGWRWLEWTSRPDAKERELIAVARDITERKRLEQVEQGYKERLEQAVRERTHELDEARLETLRRLALAAEYRDDQTFEHTERVGHTAALMAAELGLSAQETALIRQAAPLHDVGKLGVPDSILLKRGPLTTEEFEQVKRHAGHGSAILSGSSSQVLQLAEEIARTHTNGGTEAATQTGYDTARSRSAAASSRSPTSSTHSPTTAPTSKPGRSSAHSRKSAATAASNSTPTSSTRSCASTPTNWSNQPKQQPDARD
jgi:hypothetical protein